MKVIELTNGALALVDDEDYDYVSIYNWYAVKSRNTFYAVRTETKNGIKRVILLHRFIMKPPKGKVIDHINRIGLDNRKTNIRFVTPRENALNMNRKGGVDNYYKNKWRCRVMVDGKLYIKSGFDSKKEATKYLTKFVGSIKTLTKYR